MGLSDTSREALIIRWRRILLLGLIDFFNGSNEFNKLIIKEILDIYEGMMKAYAETLLVPLQNNGYWRKHKDIFSDICNNPNVLPEIKEQLKKINNEVYSREFNSLRKLRNNETHSLNLPDIPKETVYRVWRLLYDETIMLDSSLFSCAEMRPELKDFFHLQSFFKIVVLDGNVAQINLDEIKLRRESFSYVSVDRRLKKAEIEIERDIWNLIQQIKTRS